MRSFPAVTERVERDGDDEEEKDAGLGGADKNMLSPAPSFDCMRLRL